MQSTKFNIDKTVQTINPKCGEKSCINICDFDEAAEFSTIFLYEP